MTPNLRDMKVQVLSVRQVPSAVVVRRWGLAAASRRWRGLCGGARRDGLRAVVARGGKRVCKRRRQPCASAAFIGAPLAARDCVRGCDHRAAAGAVGRAAVRRVEAGACARSDRRVGSGNGGAVRAVAAVCWCVAWAVDAHGRVMLVSIGRQENLPGQLWIETLGRSTFPARFMKPGKYSHVTWLGGNKAKY